MLRTATIRGKRWALAERPGRGELGHCYEPGAVGKTMYIPQNGRNLDHLDTIIHEAIHAGAWDLSEDAVDRLATDIARLLWRLNWRKQA
jgi:hypothetical protein